MKSNQTNGMRFIMLQKRDGALYYINNISI